MNYIVLDLEWNQSISGKEKFHKKIPFEVIEIGAVKCNEKFEVIDSFSQIIKPVLYKVLHFKSRELTSITYKELKKGKPFKEVFEKFINWCGDDFIFCTWGNTDLLELQRNVRYHQCDYKFPFPLLYYDVQKLFSLELEEDKKRKSLEYAVEHYKIKVKKHFHRAVNDADYTAKVMKHIPLKKYEKEKSIDYYHIPKNKKEEIYYHNGRYEKYVSREFLTKEDAMRDKMVTMTKCGICNRVMRKKIRWFASNTRQYYCVAICPEHGLYSGKIRMKKTESDGVFVIRRVTPIDMNGFDKIKERKIEIQKKRREKRKKPEA